MLTSRRHAGYSDQLHRDGSLDGSDDIDVHEHRHVLRDRDCHVRPGSAFETTTPRALIESLRSTTATVPVVTVYSSNELTNGSAALPLVSAVPCTLLTEALARRRDFEQSTAVTYGPAEDWARGSASASGFVQDQYTPAHAGQYSLYTPIVSDPSLFHGMYITNGAKCAFSLASSFSASL